MENRILKVLIVILRLHHLTRVGLDKRVSAARDDKMYAEKGGRKIARIAGIALYMNDLEG